MSLFIKCQLLHEARDSPFSFRFDDVRIVIQKEIKSNDLFYFIFFRLSFLFVGSFFRNHDASGDISNENYGLIK